MTVPSNLFAPGGKTGIAKEKVTGVIPIQWLEAHPAVRRWTTKTERSSLGAAEVFDTCLDLQDGFEGIIRYFAILGKADVQGDNDGIGWRLLFDGVPAMETLWNFATGYAVPATDRSGRFDYMWASDGQGRSWIEMNHWIPQGVTVTVGMNNNGGTTSPMGWVAWGMYWPLSLHEEWMARGWRGK